jgi:Group II intron, maturase-specific domain
MKINGSVALVASANRGLASAAHSPGPLQTETSSRDWHLNRRSGADLFSLAREINPQVQGWINYYGAFYRSELCFLAWRINEHLVRWAMHKFKRFRGKYAKTMAWLQSAAPIRPVHQP